MGFRLIPSPVYARDPARSGEEQYSVVVYAASGDGISIHDPQFGRIYGPTAEIARMRAELICMAVNDRPALQEYPTSGGAQGNGALRNKETANVSTEN